MIVKIRLIVEIKVLRDCLRMCMNPLAKSEFSRFHPQGTKVRSNLWIINEIKSNNTFISEFILVGSALASPHYGYNIYMRVDHSIMETNIYVIDEVSE